MSLPLLAIDQSVAAALVAVAWQGALLTLSAALALRLLPRISAAARFCVWTALFLILVLLPFIPHAQWAGATTGVYVDPWWSLPITLLWAGLSLLRAAQLAHAFLRLRSISRRARPLPTPVASSARNAALCLSQDVLRPSVVGFFHPKILIPDALYARLTPAELEHILLHEQQHLHRRDDWLNLLQKLGLVLFPLNPALVWVERRLCFERELACDEGVLAVTGAPESYARSLVSLAEHTLLGRQFSLALGAWGQRSELTRRVHRILALRTPTLNPRVATAALALLCTGLAGAAVALSGSPHLISFTPSSHESSITAMNTATNTAAKTIRQQQPPQASLEVTSFDQTRFASSHPTLAPAVMHVAPRVSAMVPGSRHNLGKRNTAVKRMPNAPVAHHWLASSAATIRPRAFAGEPKSATLESIALRTREHSPQVEDTFAFGLESRSIRRLPRSAKLDARRANSPAFVVTVFTTFTASPTYAAVPTPNGWLIFQL
jgi:hypothetical protein